MFGNISQLLEMKKKAEELKAKMESIVVSSETNGITVDCNGNRRVLAIHISGERLNDKSKLEEDICEAVNKALSEAEKASMNDIAAMTGGMPGLNGLFGK